VIIDYNDDPEVSDHAQGFHQSSFYKKSIWVERIQKACQKSLNTTPDSRTSMVFQTGRGSISVCSIRFGRRRGCTVSTSVYVRLEIPFDNVRPYSPFDPDVLITPTDGSTSFSLRSWDWEQLASINSTYLNYFHGIRLYC
jgi:hypothetical protein